MNKVKFGLSNVHIAKMNIAANGAITYGTPFALPGAVNLSLSAQGDNTDFYADNILYFSGANNQGYEGDLELAIITDEFRKTILGETEDSNGALIESASDIISPFAIGFQIEGDEKNRKFWYYNATVSRPNSEAATIEASKEVKTDTLTIKTMPRKTDKKVRACLTETASNKSVYDSFFESVYEQPISA